MGDLNDPQSLPRAMQDVEILFHAAAYYPKRKQNRSIAEQVRAAETEIAHVLAAAKATRVRRLVFTSTLTTIGQPPRGGGRLADERDLYHPGDQPRNAYTEAKIAMERAALAENNGLEVVVTNPTAVFGPGDVHLGLGRLLLAAARGLAFAWVPATVNVVDVRDVAAAHIRAARHGVPGERYILGGHNLSMKQALAISAKAAGRRGPWLRLPIALLDALIWLGDHASWLPLPANHLRSLRHGQGYNTARAASVLGLQARPFEHTVRDALDWFRLNGDL
jgi:dihydroflavonol-4-reductase